MKLVKNLEYDKFLNLAKQKNQHNVFHSLSWAKFREKSFWEYEIVGLENNNELVAATLILTKKLPKLNTKFAHIPRGFIIDYNNDELVQEFTNQLKKYLKAQKVFAFRIDPDIILHEITKQKEIIEGGKNNYKLVENLKKMGYKHQGYVNNFEGILPRFTFRNYLNEKTIEQMYDELYYKTRTNIQTAQDKGIEIQYSTVDDIDEFLELLHAKAKRDGIVNQSKEYFVNLLNTFNEQQENSARICFTFLNTKKYFTQSKINFDKINNEYKELESKKQEENISAKRLKKINNMQKNIKPKLDKAQKEIDFAKEAYETYPDGIRLTGSIYVIHENRAWFLFTGSSEKYRKTMPAYLNLWEMIKKLKEENIEFLDLFGASGDISEDSPYFGIYLFKNRFNGTFTEFIGEFDYVINSKYYFLYKKIAPKLQTSRDSKTLRFFLKLIKK